MCVCSLAVHDREELEEVALRERNTGVSVQTCVDVGHYRLR